MPVLNQVDSKDLSMDGLYNSKDISPNGLYQNIMQQQAIKESLVVEQ